MRKIWLISTDHLEEELWFRDEEDFKVGMNVVAIQAACSPKVIILAFILMSNHVHFVLKGTHSDVEYFVRQFKKRYSMYFQEKWGIKKILRLNGVDIREIPYEDEAVERAIAYVQMNCVAANICAHPSQYPWGTGNSFFNQTKPSGTQLKDLSVRARARILHSRCDSLPCNWHVNPEGYILPPEYVDVKAVEGIFRNPKRLIYFQNTSSKARKRLASEECLPAFRDQVLLAALPDLLRSLFGKESFLELSDEERPECLRQIRFRFSADIHQVARVCGLSYAEASRIIDTV